MLIVAVERSPLRFPLVFRAPSKSSQNAALARPQPVAGVGMVAGAGPAGPGLGGAHAMAKHGDRKDEGAERSGQPTPLHSISLPVHVAVRAGGRVPAS